MDETYGKIPAPHFDQKLLNLVKTGRVYSLSFVNSYPPKFPCGPAPGMIFNLSRRHRLNDINLKGNTVFTEADETITMSGHAITHLDALCHIGEIKNDKVNLYGNILADEVENFRGFKKLGIEKCPPIIIRGVLLDIPRYKNEEVLPESYIITPEDLQGTADLEKIIVKGGDCVLIRTGFSKIWRWGSEAFYERGPGPGIEAAQWFIDHQVILTGSDTLAYERCPSPTHPLHRKLINNNGILIMKTLNLEDISSDKVYEFLFIALPLKIFGATASPINPIAVC